MSLPFVELMPGTPEYRQILYSAIKSRNRNLLAQVRNKYGRPIHIVSNWFWYSMVMIESKDRFIVIYDKTAEDSYNQFKNSLKD